MSTAETAVGINPFPGLRPFRETERYLFFGRERQVDTLVNKLADTRFLAVVGTSGSGKSSLVNCGLRPALHGGRMTSNGTSWRVAQFRPGSDPQQGMANALAADGVLYSGYDYGNLPLDLVIDTNLRMSKRGLIETYEQANLDPGVNLLVVVDQFEELFRYKKLADSGQEDEEGYRVREEATAFVNLLLEVKEQTRYPIYVVITMRSDFLGDCAQFAGLPEAINEGQYLVPRMTRDERRAAIAGPVAVGGAEITPTLLTRLVNDVGDNPDQLSILQHALNRTWACWQHRGRKGPLDLSHYNEIGTMAQALHQHAEQAYAELDTERKKQICEQLFKALTDKGTDIRGIRRPTKLSTLCALTNASEDEVTEVIEVFRDPTRSFLMPPAGEAIDRETVVDISHESLMRVWQRLKGWADDEALSAQTYRRLVDTAVRYQAGGASLWGDPELQLALDWREKEQPTEAWAALYRGRFEAAMGFLDESLALRVREAQQAKERLEHEQQQAQALALERGRAEEQEKVAKSLKRRLWFAAGFALLAVILLVLALVALLVANQQTKIAEVQTALAEESANEAERHRQFAEVARTAAVDSAGVAQEQRLLAVEARDEAERQRQAAVDSARVAREQRLLALEARDEAKHQQQIATQARQATLGLALASSALNELGRGEAELSALLAREAFLINKKNGDAFPNEVYDALRQSLNSLDSLNRGGPTPDSAKTSPPNNYTYGQAAVEDRSPDGTLRATGHVDGVVRLYMPRGDTTLRGHQGPVTVVKFSPNGTLLASGSGDRSVRFWKINPADGKLAGKSVVLEAHRHWVLGLDFEGETLVVYSKDQTKDGIDETFRRWKINPERLAEEVCDVVSRPLTQEEWQDYVGADISYSEYEPCSR